jgi:hypothetical protein
MENLLIGMGEKITIKDLFGDESFYIDDLPEGWIKIKSEMVDYDEGVQIMEAVVKSTTTQNFYKISWSQDSWEGEYNDYEVVRVYPKEKVITVYEESN